MKRILVLILAMVLASGCLTVSGAGEPVITERPDIKIIIDGVKGTYTNTPVIVNGRTMLPLRELLENLGVPNDDQHIIWNGQEKSVTAIKDSTKLFMKVGGTAAKINNKDVTIDAAPVNYKGRVYIPARFVAEAFNKVVVWDSLAGRIYIRDKTEFNQIKSMLETSVALMDGLKRYKEAESTEWYETTETGVVTDYSYKMSGFTDIQNKSVHWILDYDIYTLDYCIKDHKLFMKDTIDNQWTMEEISDEEFNDHFIDFIKPGDVFYAALFVDQNRSGGSIRLKGNVSFDYYNDTDPTQKVMFDDSQTEVIIDKATGYITEIRSFDRCKVTPEDEEAYTAEYETVYTTSDYNGNFSTKLPDLLK